MSIVADRDQLWRKFLYALYDTTAKAPRTSMLDFRVVAESAGIENANEQADVAQWLVAHHLAEWRAIGGQIGISSAGVHSVEDEGGELTFLSVVEIREVEALVSEIRRACELSELTVQDEDRIVFEAELATIEAQVRSPSAKRKVVGVALRGLGGPLLDVGAGPLGRSVLQLAQRLAT